MRRGVLGLVATWLVIALPAWAGLFLHAQEPMVIAGHDAVVRPTLDHHVRLVMGPYLPDLRMRTDSVIGVRIEVGKTRAADTTELVQRYALIADHPDAEERSVSGAIRGMLVDTGLQAGLLAALPICVWLLLGPRRRAELLRLDVRRALAVTGTAGIVVLLLVQPWRPDPPRVQPSTWIDLPEAVPELTVPVELRKVQVQGGLLTGETRKLVASAFDSFDRSKAFYAGLVDKASSLKPLLHEPEEGQRVAVLVSDRHDNIGMDPVVRAVADEAGAEAILDAGDDTSTGEAWETFSLDSLDATFDDYDTRIAISGNHDHGTFVSGYLKKHGWTHLDEKAESALDGVRFYGVDDPRSSGLGAWREVRGRTFQEVRAELADDVCEMDEKGERVATLIVHDANLAKTALERGCTDLVVAGHLHVQLGPERVVGENGKVGYTYTNGTTGGAAYAVAVGSKLRREAEFTFVTYAEGRPVGIQPVRVSTHGEFFVGAYIALDLG